MKYEYVIGRISAAVFELCTGQDEVRKRLLCASNELISLNANNFPPELIPLWNQIHCMLTRHGPDINSEGEIVEGAIKNTLRKIRKKEGTDIATKILLLNAELQKAHQ